MAKHYNSREVLLALLFKKKANEEIRDGDKVQLNIKKIKRHPDYDRMNGRYKQFVEENAGTVFTVCIESQRNFSNIVSLKESNESWLFWTGDLIKVK